eukprot:9473205-Pyramimonas_sp.AAC.1
MAHSSAEPRREICIQAKASDIAHKKMHRRDKRISLLSVEYGQAGVDGDPANFDFVAGRDASTASIWSTAIIPNSRGDVYAVASA